MEHWNIYKSGNINGISISSLWRIIWIYPLVICYIAIENTPFSLLIYLFEMVIFYSFLYVCQRVGPCLGWFPKYPCYPHCIAMKHPHFPHRVGWFPGIPTNHHSNGILTICIYIICLIYIYMYIFVLCIYIHTYINIQILIYKYIYIYTYRPIN